MKRVRTTWLRSSRVRFSLLFSSVALLLFPFAFGALANSLQGNDLGKKFSYVPLVRHYISQRHCYDDGTFFCETEERYKPAFTKEFTLGYLFEGNGFRRFNPLLEPIYSCVDRGRTDTGNYMVTAGTVDGDAKGKCRDAGLRAYKLGYIAHFDSFEAAVPLYRCHDDSGSDVLLTDDTTECAAAGYSEPEKLGYIAASGYLPMSRLQALCGTSSSPHCLHVSEE